MSKNKKYWQRRFGNKTAGDAGAYHHHLDFRNIDGLDDDGLVYLLTGVKGVDMLDLNETEITNESIKRLTGLEYIKELRMKDCRQVDDRCAEDLNKLTGLEFLHLKDTPVTIDGLLKLNALTGLKELMFSAGDDASINQKMEQLRAILPGCAFTVNSKPYYFDNDPG